MKRRIDSTKFLLIVFFLSGLFFVFCSLTVEAQNIGTVWGAKRDSVLTINKRIQKLADRLLENKQGSIVALDPTTGEILCMSSSSFDTDTINRAVSVTYEPGSTFKIAQALAQLNNYDAKIRRYFDILFVVSTLNFSNTKSSRKKFISCNFFDFQTKKWPFQPTLTIILCNFAPYYITKTKC